MPLYTYECKECGKQENAYRSINDRHDGPECHGKMEKLITGTLIAPVLGGGSVPGYRCPVTEKWVTSRRERRNIMKKHNLVDAG